MSDLNDHIKDRARNFTQTKGFNPFSYHQCLDLAARLIVGAESWNHLTPEFEPGDESSLDMTEVIRRLQLAAKLIGPEITQENDFYCMDLVGYRKYSSWYCAAYIWLTMLGDTVECSEHALLELLKTCPDLEEANLPGTIQDGEMVSILDAKDYPVDLKIKDILGNWFYRTHLKDLRIPWDNFGSIATAQGYDDTERELYRAICREAFNHSWDIQSQIAVGLFDVPFYNGESLKQFDSTSLKDQLMAIWHYEEPELAS